LLLAGAYFFFKNSNNEPNAWNLCKDYLKKDCEEELNQMAQPSQYPDLHPVEIV